MTTTLEPVEWRGQTQKYHSERSNSMVEDGMV